MWREQGALLPPFHGLLFRGPRVPVDRRQPVVAAARQDDKRAYGRTLVVAAGHFRCHHIPARRHFVEPAVQFRDRQRTRCQ